MKELEACSRALAAVLKREMIFRSARLNAEASIVSAERNILDSDGEDSAVEGFMNWLPEARLAIERACIAEREVGIDVAVAYQAFILAKRASERAVKLSACSEINATRPNS